MAEFPGCAGREHGFLWVSRALCEPGAQDRDCLLGQLGDSMLAALSQADVRTDAEVDVAALQTVSSDTLSPVWTASSSSA